MTDDTRTGGEGHDVFEGGEGDDVNSAMLCCSCYSPTSSKIS